MERAGPTVRSPNAATAASPLPEESATGGGADRHRLRRHLCRARTGEPFLARIAQCVRPFSSVGGLSVTLRMISGASAAVSGLQLLQLVAAQGVAATVVDHMPEEP
jgi:hypothetical protein